MTRDTEVPPGSWLVALGENKTPVEKFGGWNVDGGPEPSGRQACWGHENTYEVPDNETAHELAAKLEETGHQAFLLDIDGANLLVLDYDVAGDGEDADIEAGKWPDAEALEEHVREEFPGQTLWRSGSGGVHVPVLLTDEAYREVFENEWRAGWGVDAFKGPAAKGYTAAPLSPGYEVMQSGGFPTWGVEHLERFEGARPSAGGRVRSRDPEGFEPAVGREEAHSAGSTDDMDVLLAAINQLTPEDFAVPCRRRNERADGDYDYEPSWRHSESGTSLGFLSDERVWYDRKEGRGMFSDKLVALDMGLIDSVHDTLDGSDWWTAVDRLRELGAPVPHWEGDDWEVTAEFGISEAFERGGDEGLLRRLRRDYAAQFRAVVREGVNGHVVGPKGVGKTYNAVAIAGGRGSVEMDGAEAVQGEFREVETGDDETKTEFVRDGEVVEEAADGGEGDRVKVTVLAPTKEKYREIIEEAEDQGVSVLRLASFPEHSALWDDWESEYLRGAFPREIYNWDECDVGEDEYRRRQDLDYDDYDLLVGAPEHAFVSSVVEDRVVVLDDADLDSYRQPFTQDVADQINRVLAEAGCEPGNWRQLSGAEWPAVERAIAGAIAGRDLSQADDVWEALEETTGAGEIDRRQFLANMPGVSLDVIDWMRAITGHLHSSDGYEDRGMRLVRDGDSMLLVLAPDLGDARQVLSMGAVPPSDEELEAAFDDMNVEYGGLYGSERHADMERAINRFVIQTSPHVHNKSVATGADGRPRTDPQRIEAIHEGVEALGEELGIEEDAHVFSTRAEAEQLAERRGGGLGDSELVDNYGALTGTNRHADSHLAVAGASQHYGEDHVRLNALYAGARPREPETGGPYQPRRWEDEVHANIESRMRRGGVYEAITRMGRNDTELTIVAADTAELPEWVQVVDQSDRVKRLSPAAEELYGLITESDEPVAIKNQGDGAVDELDYSAVRLYEARDELLEAGLVEEAPETGAYGTRMFEPADDEPVNPGIMGLRMSRLTGSSVREARNPDWGVQRLETDVERARADPDGLVQTGLEGGWGTRSAD